MSLRSEGEAGVRIREVATCTRVPPRIATTAYSSRDPRAGVEQTTPSSHESSVAGPQSSIFWPAAHAIRAGDRATRGRFRGFPRSALLERRPAP